MKTTIRAALLFVSMLAAMPDLEAQSNKQVLVAVVDAAGAPVIDLQPGEFELRENNLPRKIVRAQLASDPMRIALIVDSSTAIESVTNQFRAGLQLFFRALPQSAEVALISIGGQARLRFPPTSDRKKLSDAASRFFADGGGAAVLDGVMEGYNQFLRRVEGRWPILALVTTDGPVGGTRATRSDLLESFLRELHASAVAAHAIVIATRGKGIPTIIALNLTEATGGSYEAIAAATALPDKMKALGEKLADQFRQAATMYSLEYLSETKGPLNVEVNVMRTGVTLTVIDRRQLK